MAHALPVRTRSHYEETCGRARELIEASEKLIARSKTLLQWNKKLLGGDGNHDLRRSQPERPAVEIHSACAEVEANGRG
jgi:hypothetical protein